MVKLGYAGVYLNFLFLLQIIDCGYSLDTPRRGDSNVYPRSMFFSTNKKTYFKKSSDFFLFFQFKENRYITRTCFRNDADYNNMK